MSHYTDQNPISEQAWMDSVLRQIGGKPQRPTLENYSDETDEPDELEKNWKREEKIILIAKKYFSTMAQRIAKGEYKHPDYQDESEVPEFQPWHGEGDPEGMLSHLKDLSEKMPRDLAIPMLKELESV
jgi:hypothetical protein